MKLIKKISCIRCGIPKIKGFYEAGCNTGYDFFPKHIWKRIIFLSENYSKVTDIGDKLQTIQKEI